MCIMNERLNRQEINSETMFKQFDLVNQNIQSLAIEITSDIAQSNSSNASPSNANSTMIPNATIISETYSDVTKKQRIDPVVLVKPKTVQRCNDTRADLNNKGVQDE